MFKNMVCALLREESIKTTLPKAKEVRPIVEKIITLGKRYQLAESTARRVHIRRLAISRLGDEVIANKVVETLAMRFKDRAGGYSRIIKAGFRYGDSAPMAVISLLDLPAAVS
jgi:large subunit ribosomal protein L17